MRLIHIRDIDREKLPLNRDVVGLTLFCKSTQPYHKKTKACYPIVIEKICAIWRSATIPIQVYSTIHKKLEKLMETYEKLVRRTKKNLRRADDTQYLNELFFICKCNCFMNETKKNVTVLKTKKSQTYYCRLSVIKCAREHGL